MERKWCSQNHRIPNSEIVRNDIVNISVDVVVNTVNPSSIIGSGVDNDYKKRGGK